MAVLAFAWMAVSLWWRPLVLEGLMFAYAVGAGGIIMPCFFTYLEHCWGRTQRTLLTTGGFFWGVLVGFITSLGYYLLTKDITWACQFGALFSALLSLVISAIQRATRKEKVVEEQPPKRTEGAIKVIAWLTVLFLLILVVGRLMNIIY
jgi:hypothetical protein